MGIVLSRKGKNKIESSFIISQISDTNSNINAVQSPTVVSIYRSLDARSWTIEAWIFSSSIYSNDQGIISQCQCLLFIVRGSRLYAEFTYNDISGSQNITNNLWYHVVFICNYDIKQQILYVNGVQDAI